MAAVLTWLRASPLGDFMRDSSPWTYPVTNLVHVLGLGTLLGAVLVLDLRLLGLWKHTPLAAIAAAASPVAAAGFTIAIVSGIGLLSANATDYIGNPMLLIKFPAIALGLLNAVAIRRSSAWRALGTRDLDDAEQRRLRAAGGVSLACWFTAIAAGRMIGYW